MTEDEDADEAACREGTCCCCPCCGCALYPDDWNPEDE